MPTPQRKAKLNVETEPKTMLLSHDHILTFQNKTICVKKKKTFRFQMLLRFKTKQFVTLIKKSLVNKAQNDNEKVNT